MKGSFRTFCTRLEIWKWIPKRQHYKKKKVKKVKFSNLWKTKRCLSLLFTMAFHFNAEEMNLNCTFDRTTVGKTFYPFVSIENYMWENLIVHPKNNCLMGLWGQGTQSEDLPVAFWAKSLVGWVCMRIPEFAWECNTWSVYSSYSQLPPTLRGCPRVKKMLNAELRESEEDFYHWLLKTVSLRDTWFKYSWF